MQDYDYLSASDGSGDAPLLQITANRSVGSTALQVSTVVGLPPKFIGTSGTLGPDGFITANSKCEFRGRVDNGVIQIDSYEPGSRDTGHTTNQVVVIRPTTGWANRIAAFLQNLGGLGTPTDIVVRTLTITSQLKVPLTGAIARLGVEKQHYGKLYLGSGGVQGGQIIPSNTETVINFGAYDDATYGVSPVVSGQNAPYIAVNRDGVYDLSACLMISDNGPSNNFILWFDFDQDGDGTYELRQRQEPRTVGNFQNWNTTVTLKAGTRIRLTAYSTNVAVRIGAGGPGTITDPVILKNFGPFLAVKEIR